MKLCRKIFLATTGEKLLNCSRIAALKLNEKAIGVK